MRLWPYKLANFRSKSYEIQAEAYIDSEGSEIQTFQSESQFSKISWKVSGDYIVHIGGYGDPAPFELWKYNAETDKFDQALSFRKLDDWHSYPYAYEITSLL